jgi:glycosyltransferase involved in cell wall biosynthesis
LAALGYPTDRITAVQNAIEVPDYASLNVSKVRGECVYIGGLSEHKGIGYLLAVAEAAARQSTDFHLTVIGDGPERERVQAVASKASWISYEGPLFGDEKARLLARAELTLMPGLLGLAIVDTFAAQAPVVTRDLPYHSPEIEYLVPNYNGLRLTENCPPTHYATVVVELLHDRQRIAALQSGCRESSARVGLPAMVTNFSSGTTRALKDVDGQWASGTKR